MKFPAVLLKAMSLHITHNQHKDYYEPVEQYLNARHIEKDDIEPEDRIEIIKQDSLWEIQWYPITPISFYSVYAATLERCFEIIENEKWT